MKSEEYANKSVIGLTLEAASDVTSGKVFKNIKNGNVDFLTVFTTILGLVAIFLPVMKYGDVYSYSAFDVEKIYTIIGIVIIVASLVFNLAVFIVFAAFSYFNRTKIDLTENLEIAYADEYAKNGEDSIYVSYNPIDYDVNNQKLANFIDNIRYEFSPDSYNLSNGDEVTVRAVYSKETAKKLKIKVINDSKEFTIEGLSESYENTDSIDEATLEKLKADAKESVQWAVGMSSINFEVSYVQSFFVEDLQSDMSNDYFANNQLIDSTEEGFSYLMDSTRIKEVIFQQLYDNDSRYTITEIDSPANND